MESLKIKKQGDYQPRYKKKASRNKRSVVRSKKKSTLKKGETVSTKKKQPLKMGPRKVLKSGV